LADIKIRLFGYLAHSLATIGTTPNPLGFFFFRFVICKLDVYESVHRDTHMKITNKMHYID